MLEYMARGILRDEEAVEDCLARVWLRAVERQEDYDPGRGAVSTWLAQLCRSTALDLLRERRRNGALAAETLGEELADSDRRLFYRKYYYLQSTAQLAAELGTTERAVEGRLYRIKKKLRAQLGGDEL